MIKMLKVSYLRRINVQFLLLFFQIGICYAQQPELEFSKLNALESFSISKSTSITEDSTGYLWIGTEEGLFKFDGHSVSTYQREVADPNSLPSSLINRLYTDSKQNLWVCTDAGICKYNPELDNFIQIVTEADTRGLAGFDINVIAEDRNGQLYVAYENSVYKLDLHNKLFSKVVKVNQGKINTLVFDRQNNIWIAASSNGGLYYFDQSKQQLTSYLNEPANSQSILNNEVYDIALIHDNLWIATYGSGIDLYNLKTGKFKHYISDEYFENFATRIFADKNNTIWICTLGCLKLYDPSSDLFFNYYNQPDNPKSLGKNLTGFYQDKQGNYWTLHAKSGVMVIKNKNRFAHFDHRPETFWFLTDKNITSVAVDGSGNLWAGNYNNGIDIFKWNNLKVERYAHQQNDISSLGNGTIFSIFRDSGNQMWIGSYLGGLQRYIPETRKFESFTNHPGNSKSIAGNDVRSISEDKNGNIWIAVHGKGVDRFDVKSRTFHHFNAQINQLGNDYTFQVFCDSRGNLWVATAYGLSLLQNGNTIFKNFITVKTDSSTINSNDIHSICEDIDQNIWIGTPEGLNKFDWQSQTFTRFSKGLKNTHVVSILNDNSNNLWVGTNSGISKFDQKTLKFTNFDQSDGLLSKEYNNRSAYKGGNNELFFGGTSGIDVFYPDSLIIRIMPLDVVMTDFKIFNQSFTYKDNRQVIPKHINYTNQIKLNYSDNSFAFSFLSINFTQSEKITYAYKLDGFDTEWIYSGNKTEANYTNLNHGKYTFRVKARYDNGEWGTNERTIDIIIVPAWWMTVWFKIFTTLIIIAIIYSIFHWRIKQVRIDQDRLEKLVLERTIEIQSKNEQLKTQALTLAQKNDQLKDLNSTKDKLFSIISHDLRSPFNTILGFHDILINDYPNLSDAERLEMLTMVHSSSKQIYSLVENLLNWASLHSSTIQHFPVSFNLKKVILKRIDLFRNLAEAKGISIDHQIADDLFAFADINIMETALRNLINNSIKFTPKSGSILVKAAYENEAITVSVIDTGMGMTREMVDTLFNLEKTKSKRGTNGEMGSGLGLVLCKEFVEKNGGSIWIESEPGKGSKFSFTIPASES
jgi:signal transduction histidine kinase/ligand-binding sensor domain-containing protein